MFGSVVKNFIPCLVRLGREAGGEAGLAWGQQLTDYSSPTTDGNTLAATTPPSHRTATLHTRTSLVWQIGINVNTAALFKCVLTQHMARCQSAEDPRTTGEISSDLYR